MSEIIKAEHVSFRYDAGYDSDQPTEILKDLSLRIERGEFLAVLGHNGSGKSTLAKHMNAILLPSGGKVYVDGMDTSIPERLFEIRQRAGMVFQNPDNQIVATIVEEDVAFALENLGIPPEEMRRRVEDALRAVNMYEYRNHAPHQLSGGQKQRVAIAGVIAMRPDCIILDEPTAMLDPVGRREVFRTVRDLNRTHGITVVLITHYMEEAAACDRVVVVDGGKILIDDEPSQVFSQVQLLKSVGLDVPQVTELIYELNAAGCGLDPQIIDEAACVDALEALLRGTAGQQKG